MTSQMPDTIRRRFEIWSRTGAFRRRVERAEERVAKWLSMTSRPYIAFSGGKDSSCILHLVRAQRPDTPAVYIDADACFPEVSRLLDETPNCIRYPASEPFLVTLARCGINNDKLGDITMQTTVYEPVERLVAENRFDGCCYGLRAEESKHRRKHAQVRGAIFKYKSRCRGVIACQPIYDWTYNDVWAYIVANDIPYAGTYDRMWEMPERSQRVSYWAGETNRSRGRYAWLRQYYPDLFEKLASIIPEVKQYV